MEQNKKMKSISAV